MNSPKAVCAKFAHTAEDGKTYNTKFYSLDAIIAVGYRVNSIRATQFRQWATNVLRQYAIRGYVIDHKRMENGTFLGEDYFEHLLAEIREIRLSERRFYQKLTDIYCIRLGLYGVTDAVELLPIAITLCPVAPRVGAWIETLSHFNTLEMVGGWCHP